MKLMAFSVFDDKAKAYHRPFFCQNVNLALRSFGDAVLDESTGLSKHAGDYRLYRVGEFDDNSGQFGRLNEPEFVANAVDFVIAEKEVKKDEKNSGR